MTKDKQGGKIKKLFRIFVLMFAFVPCALLLTACGDDYDRAKNEANFKSAVEKTANLGENYTITTSSNETGMFADEVSTASIEDDSTIIKINGNDFSLIEGSDISYTIDGITYVGDGNDGYVVSGAQNISIPSFDMSEISDEALQEMIDYAFSTNSEAIKTNGSNVSITVNFAKYLNDIMDIIAETEESENDSLADLIDNILAHYEITLPTIGESDAVIGQGQIENFLDEMDNLTIQEICDYVEDNTGYDVVASIKTVLAAVQLTMIEETDFVNSTHTSTNLAVQYASSDFALELVNEYLSMSLSDVVEQVIATINPEIDFGNVSCFAFVKDYLTNNSLSYLFASSMTMEEEPTALEVLEAKEMLNMLLSYTTFNKINFTLTLKTSGEQFVGAGIKFDLKYKMFGEATEGTMSYDFDFSDIGSTVVIAPELSATTGIEVNSVVIINSEMVVNGEIAISNFEDIILTNFFADGVEVKADDGVTTLVTITKNTGADTFTITLSNEIIAELFAQGVDYNLVKVTATIENKELTMSFVVDNA